MSQIFFKLSYPVKNWSGEMVVNEDTMFTQVVYNFSAQVGQSADFMKFSFMKNPIEAEKHSKNLEQLGIMKNLEYPVVAEIKKEEKKKADVLEQLLKPTVEVKEDFVEEFEDVDEEDKKIEIPLSAKMGLPNCINCK